jgi:hypothetical protein
MKLLGKLGFDMVVKKTELSHKLLGFTPENLSVIFYGTHEFNVGDLATSSVEDNSDVYRVILEEQDKIKVRKVGKVKYNQILSNYSNGKKAEDILSNGSIPKGSVVSLQLNRGIKIK